MDDLISRQAAISVADDYMTDEAQDIRDRIVLLPSAERHGRWEKTGKKRYYGDAMCVDFEWRCSCCGKTKWASEQQQPTDNYCSNCGSRMDQGKRRR